MALWAQLDDNNKVINVTVGSDNDPDGGYQWLIDNLGGRWVQTFESSHRMASVGDTYLEEEDMFIPPQPYPSWSFSQETLKWEPPVPEPILPDDNTTVHYHWDEEQQQWIVHF